MHCENGRDSSRKYIATGRTWFILYYYAHIGPSPSWPEVASLAGERETCIIRTCVQHTDWIAVRRMVDLRPPPISTILTRVSRLTLRRRVFRASELRCRQRNTPQCTHKLGQIQPANRLVICLVGLSGRSTPFLLPRQPLLPQNQSLSQLHPPLAADAAASPHSKRV